MAEDTIDTNPPPKNYTSKTDAELEKLAWDIIGGQVWGPWSHDDYMDSFMVLKLLDREQLKQLHANRIACVYEYVSKAGPMAVNGMPMFMSMHMLDRDDSDRLMERLKAVEQIKNERMGSTH